MNSTNTSGHVLGVAAHVTGDVSRLVEAQKWICMSRVSAVVRRLLFRWGSSGSPGFFVMDGTGGPQKDPIGAGHELASPLST